RGDRPPGRVLRGAREEGRNLHSNGPVLVDRDRLDYRLAHKTGVAGAGTDPDSLNGFHSSRLLNISIAPPSSPRLSWAPSTSARMAARERAGSSATSDQWALGHRTRLGLVNRPKVEQAPDHRTAGELDSRRMALLAGPSGRGCRRLWQADVVG